MTTYDIAIEEELFQFMEKYADRRCKAELLMFWARHPNASFSRPAIYLTQDDTETEGYGALEDMIKAGLVEKHHRHGMTLYSLTTNEKTRQLIIALATFGRVYQQSLLKRLEVRGRLSYIA